jgi:flagellar biosynthesis/type III secretory pathway protein FliH
MRYLQYQQRYWNRIRQDQLRLQQARYYDNIYNNYRYNRGGSWYYTSSYGAQQIQNAIQYGYEEGFRAGQADRYDGWGYNYDSSYGYQDASYGYDSYYIGLDEYNYYFREGFRRGYEDGYYDRYSYGRYNNGKYQILGNVLSAIFSFIAN